ncbi:MAG: DUF2680 domain-containing protein [Bacillota bacterium]
MKKAIVSVLLVLVAVLFFAPGMLIGAESPAFNPGQPGQGFRQGMMGRGGMGGGYGMAAQVADVLGSDVNDVVKEIQGGKSYLEIAAAKGVSAEDLTQKLLTAHQARLDEYVQAGTMTKEQAEFMQSRMEQNIKTMLEYKNDGTRGFGRRGQGCGGGRMGFGFNRTAPASTNI